MIGIRRNGAWHWNRRRRMSAISTGRLLAVFEELDRDTYDPNEQRETNAIRMQSVFAKRPLYAARISGSS